MTMEPKECRRLVFLLLAAFPTQVARLTPTDVEGMLAIYAATLADLDAKTLEDAIVRLVRSVKWIPTVAEIRGECGRILHGEQRAGAEAWGEVLRAVRSYGHHRRPGVDFEFHDPLVLECVRTLLWEELCASSNPVADRARFVDLYDQLAARERKEAAISVGGASRKLPTRGAVIPISGATKHVMDRLLPTGDDD